MTSESSLHNIVVPALGESILEGSVVSVLKKEGSFVKKDEVIAEIETDKVGVEVVSDVSGVVTLVSCAEGDVLQVGDKIITVSVGEVPANKGATQETHASSNNSDSSSNEGGVGNDKTPPSARKMMVENNIKVSEVEGTGKDGRVLKGDVIEHLESRSKTQPAVRSENDEDNEEVVKMSRLRQTIAKRLKESQNTAAILTTFNEIDMTSVIEFRKKYKELFEKKYAVKLGFMSFFIKAAVNVLQEIPAVNAEIRGDSIVYKNYYHVSVAVGTDKGLVVPVVRNADQYDCAAIEKDILSLAKRAREGKLSVNDLQGGTFSITNGGVYGSLLSTPIINPPQSAILGLHSIQKRAMVMPDGSIEARDMMYVALSYDHRIIDGKEAVVFLKRVKELMEDPARLVIGV